MEPGSISFVIPIIRVIAALSTRHCTEKGKEKKHGI